MTVKDKKRKGKSSTQVRIIKRTTIAIVVLYAVHFIFKSMQGPSKVQNTTPSKPTVIPQVEVSLDNDPDFQDAKNRTSAIFHQRSGDARFVEHDELRYALRSAADEISSFTTSSGLQL